MDRPGVDKVRGVVTGRPVLTRILMPVLGGDDEGVGSLGPVEADGVGDRLGDSGAAVDRQ